MQNLRYSSNPLCVSGRRVVEVGGVWSHGVFQVVRNGQPDHHRNTQLYQPAPLRSWRQTVFR